MAKSKVQKKAPITWGFLKFKKLIAYCKTTRLMMV